MSCLSKATCCWRMAACCVAYFPRYFALTTAFASWLAAHAASFPDFAWTVIWTSGLICAVFVDEVLLATACEEMPFLKAETFFAPHAFATVLSTTWEWTIWATAPGFVCGVCTGVPPVGEYGWPR